MFAARLMLVLIFLMLVLELLAFDVWAWSSLGRQATASALISDWAKEYPFLPFVAGLILGHLFW